MKFVVEEKGQPHTLELEQTGNEIRANVDGRDHVIEVQPLPDGGYLLLRNGAVFEARAAAVSGNEDQIRVTIGRREFEFTVRDPKRLAHHAGAAAAEGKAQLVALMPGKIVGVLMEVGAEVAANQSVLVVEAMKMQNEMRSPRAGVLRELRVAIGDTVNGGDVLAVIE